MAVVLDIIMSTVLGGILILNVLTANDMAAEYSSVYSGDMIVQEILVTTAQYIEGEFRNMGFGVPQGQPTIVYADSSTISFLIDVNRTGVNVDTVRYTLGSTAELMDTPNELDRNLYRSVNGGNRMTVGVVTIFRLRYITRTGVTLTTPVPTDRLGEVQEVEITMEIQNPYAMSRRPGETKDGERNALYSSSFWQQTRLASQNSRR